MTDKPHAVKADELLDKVRETLAEATRHVEQSNLSDETFEQAEDAGQEVFELQKQIRDEYGIKEV